jgi:hypothetical protein
MLFLTAYTPSLADTVPTALLHPINLAQSA